MKIFLAMPSTRGRVWDISFFAPAAVQTLEKGPGARSSNPASCRFAGETIPVERPQGVAVLRVRTQTVISSTVLLKIMSPASSAGPAPRERVEPARKTGVVGTAASGKGVASGVDAILFDLDNTLVDLIYVKRAASAACARAMIAAGADLGLEPPEAGSLLFEHYMDHGIESDTAFESFLRRNLRNKMSLSQSAFDRTLAAGINAYLRTKDTLMVPYPGVTRALLQLVRRGYRLGVVTDAPRLKAWQRLWAVSLADFFEVVVTRMEHNPAKPDAAPFRAALEALALPPHKVAMVGDWTERDVIGGNRLGLFTVHARYGRQGTEDLPRVTVDGVTDEDDREPDAVADSFPQLLRIFGEKNASS